MSLDTNNIFTAMYISMAHAPMSSFQDLGSAQAKWLGFARKQGQQLKTPGGWNRKRFKGYEAAAQALGRPSPRIRLPSQYNATPAVPFNADGGGTIKRKRNRRRIKTKKRRKRQRRKTRGRARK